MMYHTVEETEDLPWCRMTKLTVLLNVLLLSSVVLADGDIEAEGEEPAARIAGMEDKTPPTTAEFYICRENGNLVVIRPHNENIYKNSMSPYFEWEGSASIFTGTFLPDRMILYWKLDIRGPDWFYITYEQAEGCVNLSIERSNGEYQDCRTAATFDELVADPKDEMTIMLRGILGRIGQRTHPRDVLSIKGYNFQLNDGNAVDRKECRRLVKLLDDDNWKTRELATEKLMQLPWAAYIEEVVQDMELTPEQWARVEMIRCNLSLELPDNLYHALVAAVGAD